MGGTTVTFDQNDITIASDRGTNGAPGALLERTTGGNGNDSPLIRLTGQAARVTGFWLKGPRDDQFNPSDSGPQATAIQAEGNSCEIDNCEIFGWSTQAISVNCPRSYGREREQSYPRISNCSIHDNMLSGAP